MVEFPPSSRTSYWLFLSSASVPVAFSRNAGNHRSGCCSSAYCIAYPSFPWNLTMTPRGAPSIFALGAVSHAAVTLARATVVALQLSSSTASSS